MKKTHLLCLFGLFACKDTRVSEMNDTLDDLKTQLVQTRSYVGMAEAAGDTAENQDGETTESASLVDKVAQLRIRVRIRQSANGGFTTTLYRCNSDRNPTSDNDKNGATAAGAEKCSHTKTHTTTRSTSSTIAERNH